MGTVHISDEATFDVFWGYIDVLAPLVVEYIGTFMCVGVLLYQAVHCHHLSRLHSLLMPVHFSLMLKAPFLAHRIV